MCSMAACYAAGIASQVGRNMQLTLIEFSASSLCCLVGIGHHRTQVHSTQNCCHVTCGLLQLLHNDKRRLESSPLHCYCLADVLSSFARSLPGYRAAALGEQSPLADCECRKASYQQHADNHPAPIAAAAAASQKGGAAASEAPRHQMCVSYTFCHFACSQARVELEGHQHCIRIRSQVPSACH
jgi:hypothetical protein